LFAGAIVAGYIGASLIDDSVITHHANPLGFLVPALATPKCSGKCKATCSGSKCIDAGCGKSIACKNPTAASFLPNQGVFAGAPLPNSRAAKYPVPPKTPTAQKPTASSFLPNQGVFGSVPLLAPSHAPTKGHFVNSTDYVGLKGAFSIDGVNAFTQTVKITKDNGVAVLHPNDWSIYTVGMYSRQLVAGKPKTSAEVIFTSQNPPNSSVDGIFVTPNGTQTNAIKQPYHKFAQQQIQGHAYTVNIITDGRATTYSLQDTTAGTPPEKFTDRDPTHNVWDPTGNAVTGGHELHTADGLRRDPLVERRFAFEPQQTTVSTNTGGTLTPQSKTSSLCGQGNAALQPC
jgi:hypothetical protein